MDNRILIATTNKHKISEIKKYFGELSQFDIISLNDLNTEIKDPEETEDTLEGNARLKSRFYAQITGLPVIADDSGIFIDILDGWPGVKSARIANGTIEQCKLILKKLEGKPQNQRWASFKTVMVYFDDKNQIEQVTSGEAKGFIIEKELYKEDENAFGNSPIFFLPDAGKTYQELSHKEKIEFSHRAKASLKMKQYLQSLGKIC
jgi:XTP/dITP diphosphohydrolase